VFARKVGVSHKRFGAVYANCAYLVTESAVIAAVGRVVTYQSQGIAVADAPELYGFALFLGYLGVATFAAVRQSMRAVQTRHHPETLRTPVQLAPAWLSIGGSVAVILFAVALWSDASTILLALSSVGIFTGARMLNLMRNPGVEHMGWFYSHMGSIWEAASRFTPPSRCSGCSESGITRSPERLACCPGSCRPSSVSQASSLAPATTVASSAGAPPAPPRNVRVRCGAQPPLNLNLGWWCGAGLQACEARLKPCPTGPDRG